MIYLSEEKEEVIIISKTVADYLLAKGYKMVQRPLKKHNGYVFQATKNIENDILSFASKECNLFI
jgi:hypothetical protein